MSEDTAAREELPPPPWQRVPQRGARRRRDPLTQEAIVEAALRVLDAEGLDGLSMRRVGEELNTGAASLYWHVGSKDGLLDLIFEHVIGEQEVPDPEPERWEEQLKEVARTMRATICATATSSGSRSAGSRWARTPCATQSACSRSCAPAACPTGSPCSATTCSSRS